MGTELVCHLGSVKKKNPFWLSVMKKKPSGMDWFCVLSVLDVGVSSHVNEQRRKEGRRMLGETSEEE